MKTKMPPRQVAALRIKSVSVSSSKHVLGKDHIAREFIEKMKFTEITETKSSSSLTGRRVAAFPPDGCECYLEYDENNPANQKDGRIVVVSPNQNREIESGRTMHVPTISKNAPIEVLFKGDKLVDWELMCVPLSEKELAKYRIEVQKNNPVVVSVNLDVRTKYDALEEEDSDEPNSQPEALAPRFETTPPPKATVPRMVIKVEPRAVVPVVPPRVEVAVEIPVPRVVTPVAPPSVNGVHTAEQPLVGNVVLKIPLDEVVVFQKKEDAPSFSGQPRKEFIQEDLQELADSIKENGQLMPGLVMRVDGIPGKKWELIGGERRWRACRMADVSYFLAIEMKPGSKREQQLLSLIENLHRRDLNPLEHSDGLQEAINAGETPLTLAKKTSISLTQLKKYLSIQRIHPELKPYLNLSTPDEDRIRLNEAEALGNYHPDHQKKIWEGAKTEPTRGLVLRKINELGRTLCDTKPKKANWDSVRAIKTRVGRRVGTLARASLELAAVKPYELAVFAVENEADINLKLIDEAIERLQRVKTELAAAREKVIKERQIVVA